MRQTTDLLRQMVRSILLEARRVNKITSVKDILDWSLQVGLEVDRKTKHPIVRFPDGSILTVPGSPSDHRSALNTRADLRRKIRKLIDDGLWPSDPDMFPP